MGRLMIAGTKSGCGKTMVTCAVLQALKNRGMDVTAFKCGPDYIDPVFHKTVIKVPSYNLDSFFMAKNTVNYLLDKNSSEISIIEGSHGFYDGVSYTEKASSSEISRWTNTPVALVVDCRGMITSIGAVIKGYISYSENNIKGIIFNGATALSYQYLKEECERLGVKAFGYFKASEDSKLESRHLGLVTTLEIDDMQSRMNALAQQVEDTIDIEALIETADSAPKLEYEFHEPKKVADVKIAYAYDRAFSFYYEDNLQLLRELGAQLIPFSPMTDEKLPEGINGLMIGGGYPELFAKELSENKTMLASIKQAVCGGLPCIAECGGFMYLHERMSEYTNALYDMVGVIKGKGIINDSLPRFGYGVMMALRDNVFCDKGEQIAIIDAHYYESENRGADFYEEGPHKSQKSGHGTNTMFAGLQHIHFYANIEFAKNFVKACAAYEPENIKRSE